MKMNIPLAPQAPTSTCKESSREPRGSGVAARVAEQLCNGLQIRGPGCKSRPVLQYSPYQRVPYDSVKEKSLAREQHRHVVLVGCVNRLLIPDRAPRLNHRGDPYIVRCIDAISEREECV